MAADPWDITSLPSYKQLSADEIDVLWTSELPETREHKPALWDLQMGFFEDAIVDICRRPGHLVVTPRELLKHLKRAGREPPCAKAVITELFRRGDITRADSLKVAEKSASQSVGVFANLRATLGRYLWSTTEADAPELEDAVVPTAALAALSEKASALLGPIATSEIHTLKSFAARLTGGNERDAEAVVAHLVGQGAASVLYTDVTPENKTPMFGVRLGRGAPTAADKGVLQTKYAHERQQRAAADLEAQIAAAKEAAVAAARSGNKQDALKSVKHKAELEKQLVTKRATLQKLSHVLMAVDEAESNKETVNALEIGMESLRASTVGGVTAGKVDDIATNFDELMAELGDTRLALQQFAASNDAEDAKYEAELEGILEEAKEMSLRDPAIAVPTVQPAKAAAAAAASTATAAEVANGGKMSAEEVAEDELQKLLAESGMEDLASAGAPADAAVDESARERVRKQGRIVAPAP